VRSLTTGPVSGAIAAVIAARASAMLAGSVPFTSSGETYCPVAGCRGVLKTDRLFL
jgi:hypothetical protein